MRRDTSELELISLRPLEVERRLFFFIEAKAAAAETHTNTH